MQALEVTVKEMIQNQVKQLNRPDLFREPLTAFSSAEDQRYSELKELIGDWHLNPTELFPEAKSVVSYFVPFTKDVAYAPKQSTQETPLWGESYAVLNDYFEHINQSVCAYLESVGYASRAIPATHTYNEEDMKSMWSHRSAAAIAGLGTFGANRMLITEKGSAGRFSTVLTAAVFKDENRTLENKCLYLKNGSCGLCFKACPVNALEPNVIRRFECQTQTRINEEFLETSIGLKNADACGRCIGACPFAYIE